MPKTRKPNIKTYTKVLELAKGSQYALREGLVMTGFEPIIAKNVQKINFKFTMISIFTTLTAAFSKWS